MKKSFLLAALSLSLGGLWAFYPKTAAPAGYMMVVSTFHIYDASSNTLTVISSEGQREEIPVRRVKVRDSSFEQNKTLLAKLNQLRQEGWRVVSVTKEPVTNSGTTNTSETTYFLER